MRDETAGAVARLLTGTALAAVLSGPVFGADVAPADRAITDRAITDRAMPQVAQAAETRTFVIPAQPLASALDLFADQAKLSFAYRTGDISTLRSPGVAGSLTPREALQRLLSGTNITFDFTSPSTITLARGPEASANAVALGPVTVEGRLANPNAVVGNLPPAYPGGQVATGGQVGLLGNRDVMDTPFNVTSYTSEYLRNNQAATLADAIGNDPSVRVNIRGRGTNNGGGDNLNIRGFLFMNQDASFNGAYGVLPFGTVPLETVERVEVLKGPSALLNGMAPSGGVGGGINIVPKRAEDNPITRLTTTYASDAQLGGHIDLGRRFGENKEFGIRFNGVYRAGDTAIDGQSTELSVASVGLDHRGERLRLSADLAYQDDRTDAASGYGGGLRLGAGVTSVPGAPDARAQTAQSWERVGYKDVYGVVRGEYDLAPLLTVYGAIGLRDNEQENFRSNATMTSSAGTLSVVPVYYPQISQALSKQAGIRGSVETGPVRHDLNFGYSSVEIEGGYNYAQWAGSASSIYRRSLIAEPSIAGLPSARKSSETELTSYAVADTMSVFDDRVQLTLGLRRQNVARDGFDIVTGAKTDSYDKSATTPAIGLVLKPWQTVSLYANYIEGLSQGLVAPSTAENANQVFPPVKTKQREVGVKADLGRIGGSLSLFEISQPNAITAPGATPAGFVYRVDGEQRNRGVELNTFGEIQPGWRVLGGVAYIEGEQTKTQGGLNNGKDAIGVPNWTFNLGTEWDASFAPGLVLSARMISTSSQFANAANTLSIPGWTRWDVGARYGMQAFDRPLTLRVNVFNLLDDDYWESVASPQGLRLGAPRTFLLSASMDF